MTARRLPVFVYGTLRAGERNHRLLAGRTRAWAAAELPGALLFHGPGYPFAVTDPAGAGVVRGELVHVREQDYDQVLSDLDLLESYVPGDPRSLYERVRRTVTGERGAAEAWVYLAGPTLAADLLASGRPVSGGDWLRRGSGAGPGSEPGDAGEPGRVDRPGGTGGPGRAAGPGGTGGPGRAAGPGGAGAPGRAGRPGPGTSASPA